MGSRGDFGVETIEPKDKLTAIWARIKFER